MWSVPKPAVKQSFCSNYIFLMKQSTVVRIIEQSQKEKTLMTKKTKVYKKNRGYNIHHRKAKNNGGTGDPANLVEVPVDHHRAFHLLFDTKSVPEIARILNDTWIDPSWELIARKREKQNVESPLLPLAQPKVRGK